MKAFLIASFVFLNFFYSEYFAQQVRFAVIGDFGGNTQAEADVATMINSWNVDFIISVGDNYYDATDGNYSQSWNALDDDVGQYYSSWIGNYQGSYGSSQFTNVINKNDTWKYSVEETDNNWETEAYNDAAWSTGNGIFGTEENLTITTPLDPSIYSFFFRKTFEIANLSEITDLYIDLLYDDGIFVFINGVEAFQDGGLSGSPPPWNATGATLHEAEQYEAHDLNSMITNLVEGTNTIAIGVWNNNTNSSDIVFDAQLRISRGTGGSSTNKFFPVPGNHDWYHADGIQVYTDYFTLPGSGFSNSSGNERYYDFVWGNIHFFMLDNYGVGLNQYTFPRHGNNGEPDQVGSNSTQANWFYNQIDNCVANHNHWRIVICHIPPYSSGASHGSDPGVQWPYQQHGAHIVMSGHEHVYERIVRNNLTYITNGIGGESIYYFGSTETGSIVQYNDDYGAMLVETNGTQMSLDFRDVNNNTIDAFTINDNALPVELSFFNGRSINGSVQLDWITETEVNNYGFDIERKAPFNPPEGGNVSGWNTIGFVEGHGNSNSPKLYNFIDNEINLSGTYYYRLKQIDNDGTYEYSDVVSIKVGIPEGYYLSQNYPNPFNPNTRIEYTIPGKQIVTLRVYNTLGEEVGELVNDEREAGSYSVLFNAANLPSGVYVYRLQTQNFAENRKMILLR